MSTTDCTAEDLEKGEIKEEQLPEDHEIDEDFLAFINSFKNPQCSIPADDDDEEEEQELTLTSQTLTEMRSDANGIDDDGEAEEDTSKERMEVDDEFTLCGDPQGSAVAQQPQQLQTKSKMHEMAVRQRLITDFTQNKSASGPVELTAEEKRCLILDGFPIPQKYPLSKSEEESLKIVRRKIKNKLSASESRRKKKEYTDSIESRLKCFAEENKNLKKQLDELKASNRDLQKKLRQYENDDKMM